jgi:lipoprotein-releasing system ATP-binding protein
VVIGGMDCGGLDDGARTRLRRSEVGFIYQFHHLLVEFSALENVVMPQRIAGLDRREAERRAHDLLKIFGLAERADHRPAELSGGEQQRVAIARAVANAPKLLLADEPTGNLDPPTAERVFQQLLAFVRKAGLAAIIATHNLELAARMDRLVQLEDGQLLEHDPVSAEVASGGS